MTEAQWMDPRGIKGFMDLLTRSVKENWCVSADTLCVTNLVGTTVMKDWYISTGKRVSYRLRFRQFQENQHHLFFYFTFKVSKLTFGGNFLCTIERINDARYLLPERQLVYPIRKVVCCNRTGKGSI